MVFCILKPSKISAECVAGMAALVKPSKAYMTRQACKDVSAWKSFYRITSFQFFGITIPSVLREVNFIIVIPKIILYQWCDVLE